MCKTIAIAFTVEDNVNPDLYVNAIVEILRQPHSRQTAATRTALSALTRSAGFAWSVEPRK